MRALAIAALLAAVLIIGGYIAVSSGYLGRTPEQTEPLDVSPEAAAVAESKLTRLAEGGEEVRLNAVELTSLFRYRPELWAIGSVSESMVEIGGDTLTLSGSVATDQIPPQPGLEAVRYLLPDTTDVRVAGILSDHSTGSVVLQVVAIEVAGMPIPPRFYPVILERLGRTEQLPPDMIALPLPDVVSGARIEDGELVLSP